MRVCVCVCVCVSSFVAMVLNTHTHIKAGDVTIEVVKVIVFLLLRGEIRLLRAKLLNLGGKGTN